MTDVAAPKNSCRASRPSCSSIITARPRVYTFTINPDAPKKPGSAGKAGLNELIRVVRLGATDPALRAAPGEEGQIICHLDSDEAFEGYWRRPDADAKAIHRGWYFTGDTGYLDADGDLFVTGRVDDMIITGRENVSPVEIGEPAVAASRVVEVAVVGLADERWGQRVAAFIKRAAPVDPTIDGAALDAYCRDSGMANFSGRASMCSSTRFRNRRSQDPAPQAGRGRVSTRSTAKESIMSVDLSDIATLLPELDGFRVEIDAARERADIVLDGRRSTSSICRSATSCGWCSRRSIAIRRCA